ncbi:hypothetical protein ACFXKI_09885 [Streptomyces mirabilis]|uniref:hypothetical protein n=1 Tax=Streptomyces mirabilis TaxID=68239 RepID=UPI00367C2837
MNHPIPLQLALKDEKMQERGDDEPAKCAGCKRPLKRRSPSGYGPVCERRRNAQPATPLRITPGAPAPEIPGQGELPLADQLTLY